ncbi:MAG TPA: ATP-binding protein [Acidimicrobiales bacterium]|nr:ATP-binding protein [Acidimicrobiales bacterium]
MPALVGGVLVAGAVAGFFATRAATGGPTQSGLQTVSTGRAGSVVNRLDGDAQLLATAAASIDGDPAMPDAALRAAVERLARSDRSLAIAQVSPTDGRVVVTAATSNSPPSLTGSDLNSQTRWRLALELARDRAAPGAAIAPGPDGRPTILDALPLYGTPDAPPDITSRRETVKGYVVSLSDVSTIVGNQAASDPDISLRIVDGDTVLAAAGRGANDAPPKDAVVTPITANGVLWSSESWSTPSGSIAPWLVLAGGLVLAVIATAVVVNRERSISAAVAEAQARNQELALVGRVGPLLQQSLALGDLLPVFVVEIGDELDLDGASICLVTEDGTLTRVFSLGSGINAAVPELSDLLAPPTSARPGEIVTVPLQRVGRVVGAFQARAVTGLEPPQMEALLAVCALLAAAIGNVRLYQDEQDMVSRLRDIDKLKTSFIGSVSHELRTSVTAIQGFAGLLEGNNDLDPERRNDYVERISRNARSLGVLVEDLLDFARFERSGLTAALRPIDLSELVPSVVDQMSSVLEGRSVVTHVEPDVIAMADTLAVERVLVNLLSNAGKYTPADSPIDVGLQRSGSSAVLTVRDHGPGVPPEEREKIFELFYRSDESARVTRGVGIGLALTRQLVLHLNGTIAVEDAPGGGALFRVTVPLAGDASLPVVAQESEPARPSAGS